MAKKQQGISEDLRELVELVAETTATKMFSETAGGGRMDYYRAVERLLYNYKRLEMLIADEDEYMRVELKGRSKDIVSYNSQGGGRKDADDVVDEIEQQKRINYIRTETTFREVEKVVGLFKDSKEFIVIRMYYFNEDADGNDRETTDQSTWGEIADELAQRGILKDEKTARRWRNNIINDMAVCMFGKPAAVGASKFLNPIGVNR